MIIRRASTFMWNGLFFQSENIILSDKALEKNILVRSQRCACLATWFCYQMIVKPGNKTDPTSWPDPYTLKSSSPKIKQLYAPSIPQDFPFPNSVYPLCPICSEFWYCPDTIWCITRVYLSSFSPVAICCHKTSSDVTHKWLWCELYKCQVIYSLDIFL